MPIARTHKIGRLLAAALPGLAWLALVGSPTMADTQPTVIHAGTLLAVPGQAPVRQQTLLIEDGVITSVRDGFVDTAGLGHPDARLIDLSDGFVLPGLMDLHVHLTTDPGPGSSLRVVTEDEADLALIAAGNARRLLEAGFTTVLDLGTGRRAHEHAIYALREAIRKGITPGPRILAVGSPISMTGGARTGRFADAVEAVVGPQGACDGTDDCRRAVREQVKRGADVIVLYNTGSLLAGVPIARTFGDDELRAIVETAHALGRKVIADGQFGEGITAAIRAGVDAVDSALMADDATIALIRKSGVYLQSQIHAVAAAVGDTPETLSDGIWGWLPRPLLLRLHEIKTREPVIARSWRAGVRRLIVASDSGVFPHGQNAQELVHWVRNGIPAGAVLEAATVIPARMLGLSDRLGTLEPGKAADLIAVTKSPLDDISELTRVRTVIKGGRLYHRQRD